MSFKTALASCWDVCKRNCTIGSPYYPFSYTNSSYSFPEFTLAPYEMYSDYAKEIPFPYNEKPCEKKFYSNYRNPIWHYKGGLTEPEDKLVSSFLGWIFTIPEMLFWSVVTLGKTLLATFLFLGLVLCILGAPILLLFEPMRDGNYIKLLKGFAEPLGSTLVFTFLALLQVPYHALKAAIRIPVGVGIAVKEIVSPSPLRVITPPQPLEYPTPIYEDQLELERRLIEYERGLTLTNSQLRERLELLERQSVELINPTDQDLPQLTGRHRLQLRELEERHRLLSHRLEERLLQIRLQNVDNNDDFTRAQTNSFNSISAPTIDVPAEKNLWQESVENLGATWLMPERYLCVISGCLMNPPFLIADGKFYNQNSIEIYHENYGKSPWTRQPLNAHQLGTVVSSVQQELVSFVIALRANYYLAKLNGEDPAIRQKSVLKIAEDASKMAKDFYENISPYIRDRHSTSKLAWGLAKDILNDQQLQQLSAKAIYTAFQHIKKITGSKAYLFTPEAIPPSFMMYQFLMAVRPLDDSYDNLIITALQEAMIEEQQVNEQFFASWQFEELAQGELFDSLNACMPETKPDCFDEIIRTIQKNSAISIRALEYTLKLIADPKNVSNFNQFETKSNNLVAVIKEFLEAYYAQDNELFRFLFLITLKETILAEQHLLKQDQTFEADVTSASFAPVWREELSVMPAEAGIQLQNQQIIPKNQ